MSHDRGDPAEQLRGLTGGRGPDVVLECVGHETPFTQAIQSVRAGGTVASVGVYVEASLSFLGLGDRSLISWGYMLNNAQPFLRTAWWMSLFPGLAMLLTVLAVNLLGDWLRDRLDPKLRQV